MSAEEYSFHVYEVSIQAIAVLIATIAAAIAIHQIRQLRITIKLAHQANVIDAVSHCTTRYTTIMSEIPETTASDDEIRAWWYRYCDLQTEQFTYFRKGILDRDVYEMWMQELAHVYDQCPNSVAVLGTREVEHAKYLSTHLPHFELMRSFFRQMANASKMPGTQRVAAIHKMIELFGPKKRSKL